LKANPFTGLSQGPGKVKFQFGNYIQLNQIDLTQIMSLCNSLYPLYHLRGDSGKN